MPWWKKTQPQPTQPEPVKVLPEHPVDYPAGTFVYTTSGNRYLIRPNGQKQRVGLNVYLSWDFPLKVLTTDAALTKYPTAITQLGFRDGSLLINIADGKMYLVSDYTRRHITSPDVLERLGVTKDDFMVVSDADINIMKRGAELN